MSNELVLRNRQRTRALDLRLLRRIARRLLSEHLAVARFEVGIHLVTAAEMARLNEHFLQHAGSTDVITFEHEFAATPLGGIASANRGSANIRPRHRLKAGLQTRLATGAALVPAVRRLHGEIFISVDDAVAQARQFRTRWQAEVVRYLIHGLLHLHGLDDLHPTARREMKRMENRWLKRVARQFRLAKLSKSRQPADSGKSEIANRKSQM